MKTNRLNRNKIYKEFLETAEEKFNSFKENNERAKYFEKIYSFYSISGGRMGGEDKRVFEVFYGKRQYDTIHRNLKFESLIEDGSTLMIQANDLGLIYISIYPAKTELRSLHEDSITLYKSIEPSKLLSDSFLKTIWDDFIAYTEYSSLDGQPSFWQKKRIQILRYTKNLIINGKEQGKRISKTITRLTEFTLSIGLSGFLIFLFSYYLTKSNESKYERNIQELRKSLIKISTDIEEMNEKQITKEDLKIIIHELDSLDKQSIDTVYIINHNLKEKENSK